MGDEAHSTCQWPSIRTKLIMQNVTWYLAIFNVNTRVVSSSLTHFVAICLLGSTEGTRYGLMLIGDIIEYVYRRPYL